MAIGPHSPPAAKQLERLHKEVLACTRCVERGYLAAAHPIFSGRHSDRIMLVGQAPGRVSVDKAVPFGGPSGPRLEHWLELAGFEKGAFRSRVYLTSLIKCDPGRSDRGHGDRKPSPQEVALCRPFLDDELRVVQPKVVLLVGTMAIAAFLRAAPLEEIVGTLVEQDGKLLLPLPHPSGASRWLNDPPHQEVLANAITKLALCRQKYGL